MLLNPYRFGAAAVSLTGLVSYWKLDEISGSAIDSHGTNHLTAINSVSVAVGNIGNARDFEKDSNQYFTIPNNASLQTGNIEFTFTAWVKFESVVARHPTIISKDNGAPNTEFTLFYHDSLQRIIFQLYPGTNTYVAADALGIPVAGVWYFIVAWHDPVADKMYIQINNGAINETANTGATIVQTLPFRIGQFGDIDSRPFDGLIDEVGFWKRLLTPAERTALYNAGNGLGYPFDGSYVPPPPPSALLTQLISYWKMDEASGNATDSHGVNHLTDNNTVTSAPGKIGTARDFELANSEYFSRASNASLQGGDIDYTFQVWVNLESKSATMIVLSKETTVREYALYYATADDRFYFGFSDGTTANQVSDTFGTKSIGVWYCIQVWNDSVNNQLGHIYQQWDAEHFPDNNRRKPGANQFRIGARDVGGSNLPFDGLIDEVGFWKRVLTPAERAELYNTGNGKTYPFT